MAWTVEQAGLNPQVLDSLTFIVIAPQDRIDKEPTFASYMELSSIEDKVQRRIDLYRSDDPDRYRKLVEFRDTVFTPFLRTLDLQLVSWEDAIADTSPESRPGLAAFYLFLFFILFLHITSNIQKKAISWQNLPFLCPGC